MVLTTFFSYRNGCNGADPGRYGTFFANALGGEALHENSYPYAGTASTYKCPTKNSTYDSGYKVSKALVDYNCNETKLMDLVSTYGAVVTAIYASQPGFSNYAGGVYTGCTSKATDHAVSVVGYGTDSVYGPYWKIKNSWGPSWGEKGYVRMQRNTKMCGIASVCYTGDAAATGTPTGGIPLPAAADCDLNVFFGQITGGYSVTITSRSNH